MIRPAESHTTETPLPPSIRRNTEGKTLRLTNPRNLIFDAVEERPVRSSHIREVPLQITLITIRLLEEFNKLCEPLVKFVAASFVLRGDDAGVSVQNVDCLLVHWTS